MADNVVQIDREALTRRRFLEAIAVAIGRDSISQETDTDVDSITEPKTQKNSGFKILVAEDNDVNRDVINRQLDMLGYNADIEIDGEKAFKRWQEDSYNLVLTDLHMPNKDGYELTAMIRDAEQQKNLTRIPIIALTANAIKGEEENCLDKGMDGYLSKPIELTRLKSLLKQWLPSATLDAVNSSQEHIKMNVVADISDEPVFDREVLPKMVGNNPDIQKHLLEKFLANSHEQIHQLLEAAELKDAETVGQIAHKLKSAARSVGAMRLGELCQKLESVGKNGDHESCLELGSFLVTTFTDSTMAIKSIMEVGETDG